MTEPTPEPITDDELRTAAMHGRIAHDASSERQTLWGEFAARASVELLAARDWAAWFAAERDELARQRAFELEAIAERQRMYRDRIAELEAERPRFSQRQFVQAHRDRDAAQSKAVVAEEDLSAARARIAELEAFVGDIACHGLRADLNPTVNSTGDMYAQMTDYLRHINSGLRDRARALVPDANVPYSGGRLRRQIQPEPVAPEPHAYIAVKRCDSSKTDGPEWRVGAAVIPAGDRWAWERHRHVELGYQLLPIVGTETGTRPAAVPQADPAGYVVVTRNSEGGVHRSATAWESLDQARAAEGVQAGYADGTGCTAAVYELREVQQ